MQNSALKIGFGLFLYSIIRVAESQMWLAENDLIDALNESQYDVYRDYRDKRDAFFKIAKELYERKIQP